MGKKEGEAVVEKVRDFKEKICGKFFVDKIVIFGSAGRKEMKADSDVDLIVVSRKYGLRDFFEITPALYDEWHLKQKIDYPVDFLLFSRKEFERLKKEVSIVSEALKEGIVV